jgi:hypothetical protein
MRATKRWGEQEPDTIPPVLIIRCIRDDVMAGYFNLADWDHNSPSYKWPRSNKALRIAGATMGGNPDIEHGEAVALMLEVALGFRT